MMIMQQTTATRAILPLLLVLTATTPVVNDAKDTPGDNYSTGYAQGLNAGKIDGGAGITNVDHCPKYANVTTVLR